MILLQVNTFIDNFLLPLLVLIVFGVLIFLRKQITKLIFPNKVKVSINYNSSFWTKFEERDYLVLNLTIINNNTFDLNNLSFSSSSDFQLTDNIWSIPDIHREGSSTFIMGAGKQINDSFEDKPISVTKRNTKTGSLIFKTKEHGGEILLKVSYLDNQFYVKIDSSKIKLLTL